MACVAGLAFAWLCVPLWFPADVPPLHYAFYLSRCSKDSMCASLWVPADRGLGNCAAFFRIPALKKKIAKFRSMLSIAAQLPSHVSRCCEKMYILLLPHILLWIALWSCWARQGTVGPYRARQYIGSMLDCQWLYRARQNDPEESRSRRFLSLLDLAGYLETWKIYLVDRTIPTRKSNN